MKIDDQFVEVCPEVGIPDRKGLPDFGIPFPSKLFLSREASVILQRGESAYFN
jgi:hypothetical protein